MDEKLLTVVSWTLYGVGVCLISTRIISRLITLRSPAKLQLDDWLMIFITAPFTGTVICAIATFSLHGPTEANQKHQIWNLQMRFALEILQIATNWLVKACLLVLYWRIFPASTSKKQRRYFTYTAVCCLTSFLAIHGLLPFWCHPMHQYWNPTPINTQCTTYRNHSITTMALNALTTLGLFVLPIPYIPTPRTILLFTLLFLGTVGSIAGVLGRYYVIHDPSSPTYLPWYIAEITTLIAYANMPFLSSLLSSSSKASYRYVSHTSLGHWPRSYRDLRRGRRAGERLASEAEEGGIREVALRQERQERGSGEAVVSRDDEEDVFECSVSIPQVAVPKLSLTSPPPELDAYWTARRVSARGVHLGGGAGGSAVG